MRVEFTAGYTNVVCISSSDLLIGQILNLEVGHYVLFAAVYFKHLKTTLKLKKDISIE